MLAIVAPGQGAQTPGFLTEWLERDSFAATLAGLSAACGIDLAHYGTQADADTIKDTAIAQPLLVAAAIATARELLDEPAAVCDLIAGHSVGELAAAALTGVLSDEAAMVFVRERGRMMAEASALRPTSMTAIIGGKPDDVAVAIEAAGLTAANNNGTGQIVAAGTIEQLRQLQENPPARARLIPLSVAGAFHTVHMQPALDHLRTLAATMQPAAPRVALLTNADGQVVADGRDYLEALVNQVANPVRWDLCMQTMAERDITGVLELSPAGTLVGIAKRNLKFTETFALNTPDQLDEARAFVASHAGSAAE